VNVGGNVQDTRFSIFNDPDASFLSIKGDVKIIMPFAFPSLKNHLKGQEGLGIDRGFHAIAHREKSSEIFVGFRDSHQAKRRLALDGCGPRDFHRGRSNRDTRPRYHILKGFAWLE
jgi:hypothetical protein